MAKRLVDGPGQTRDGDVIGTPTYMAPEQAYGKIQDISPATDVYSLGAILYTRCSPAGGAADGIEHPRHLVLMVRRVEPVSPRRLQPRIDRDLETICLKCLRKEPAKRYADAQALADDLQRFLDRMPILARPTARLGSRGWKCRRGDRGLRVCGRPLVVRPSP